MGVTTCLDVCTPSRVWSHQIGSHIEGRTSIEGKRRLQHPTMPNRQQL
jgi:hypothetical protein